MPTKSRAVAQTINNLQIAATPVTKDASLESRALRLVSLNKRIAKLEREANQIKEDLRNLVPLGETIEGCARILKSNVEGTWIPRHFRNPYQMIKVERVLKTKL